MPKSKSKLNLIEMLFWNQKSFELKKPSYSIKEFSTKIQAKLYNKLPKDTQISNYNFFM